jgi:hypothetical protein
LTTLEGKCTEEYGLLKPLVGPKRGLKRGLLDESKKWYRWSRGRRPALAI